MFQLLSCNINRSIYTSVVNVVARPLLCRMYTPRREVGEAAANPSRITDDELHPGCLHDVDIYPEAVQALVQNPCRTCE